MEPKDYIELAAALIGLCGFAFGLRKYSPAQRWKRSEFAAEQLDILDSDPDIRFCCQALDYSSRRVPNPEKYRVFTSESSFTHDQQLLVNAFPHESVVDHYISIGLFTIRHRNKRMCTRLVNV